MSSLSILRSTKIIFIIANVIFFHASARSAATPKKLLLSYKDLIKDEAAKFCEEQNLSPEDYTFESFEKKNTLDLDNHIAWCHYMTNRQSPQQPFGASATPEKDLDTVSLMCKTQNWQILVLDENIEHREYWTGWADFLLVNPYNKRVIVLSLSRLGCEQPLLLKEIQRRKARVKEIAREFTFELGTILNEPELVKILHSFYKSGNAIERNDYTWIPDPDKDC